MRVVVHVKPKIMGYNNKMHGRPRKRWTVDIEEDIQIMGIRRCRKQCEGRA